MIVSALKAEPQHAAWAESLACRNMQDYWAKRGVVWDANAFNASWTQTENFLLLADTVIAGFFRCVKQGEALYIKDLQVAAEYQRRGLGFFAIQFLENLAKQREFASLRLRVFRENPACPLYLRLGFVLIEEDASGLLLLEKLIVL